MLYECKWKLSEILGSSSQTSLGLLLRITGPASLVLKTMSIDLLLRLTKAYRITVPSFGFIDKSPHMALPDTICKRSWLNLGCVLHSTVFKGVKSV